MLENLLKKLIKTSAGKWRTLMATIGLTVAMLLILAAMQLQVNFNDLLYGKSNQDSIANFLVVNKKITEATLGQSQLSTQEIEDLKQQPFIQAVGKITPSQFKITASGGNILPFSSELFFESVPDEFLDIKNPQWQWKDDAQFIPVVIPNMFLDLYNFGFASSQQTPQLTQERIQQIPLQITIYGTSGLVHYPAKVVGFSDRISSILVPQQFMDWANQQYGNQQKVTYSRVVILTKDPGNPALTQYLATHGLKTDAERTRFSKYREIVHLVVNISWITGVMMLMFALLIFVLFIELTILSSKDEMHLLITLGASPKQLRYFLLQSFFPLNIFIAGIVLMLVAVMQYCLHKFLQTQNMHIQPWISMYTIGAVTLILLVLFVVNKRTIQKVVR